MSLTRRHALHCNGPNCNAVLIDTRPETQINPRDVDAFRRWTRRHGWRRVNRCDLCPSCTTDQRVRDRLARRPGGMF